MMWLGQKRTLKLKQRDRVSPFRAGILPKAVRRAFTLVEILVVLAIMALLSGLLAAAAMLVLGRQRVSNTETLLKKVGTILDRQWTAVVDQAKKEQIPDYMLNPMFSGPNQTSLGLLDMAGASTGSNDVEERARVIWIKLRLKQQFPMTLGEVLYPTPPAFPLGSGNPNGNPVRRQQPPSGPYVPYFAQPMAPNPSYMKVLQAAKIAYPDPLAPAFPRQNITDPLNSALNNNRPVNAFEPAICLLLALTQSRAGVTVSEDDLGTGVIVDAPASLPGPGGVVPKMLVDAYGQPLAFYRFPSENAEVDAASPATKGATESRFRDPLDPRGVLQDPTWNNQLNYRTFQGVWAFEMLLHPVHVEVNNNYVPRSSYTVPVAVSAGKDSAFGLFPWNPITWPQPTPPLGTFPPPYPPITAGLLPNLMRPDPNYGSNDDLFSYRLRLGGRGD